MARTYTERLNDALDYQRSFNQAHIVALAHPGNNAAEREELRTAAALCGYCDAMADMFGKSYDDVYQDVHDFTEAVNKREGSEA